MREMLYPYSNGDNLKNRHDYAYSPYHGERFLEAWIEARKALLKDTIPLEEVPMPVDSSYPSGSDVHTAHLLEALFYQLTESDEPQTYNFQHWLNWIIKRFEVSKRLHVRYALSGKRTKPLGTFRNLSLYVRFAEILVLAYSEKNKVPALNALIKCLDTLYSVTENLTAEQKQRVARVATKEQEFVLRLRSRLEVNSRQAFVMPSTQIGDRSSKPLSNVTLLVADTIRSRAYTQALLAYGFHVENILLLTSSTRKQWGQSDQLLNPPTAGSFGGAFIPDLRIPLDDTCQALTHCVKVLDTGSVNNPVVIENLHTLNPELVIFSGFGGEIVHEDVLGAAGPFLHMHAGELPKFRGSTTAYYSFLMTGNAGVSAILLSPDIDTGEIVYRALYPLPPAQMNIDYYYDGIIRSDVLIRVLAYYSTHGRLPDTQAQNTGEGETYYIVHPLIKTMSILKVREQARA
ncbi:formyltransferase family protein [Halomonas sp. hl-4]|uniref:formyltransferase family protein n=1 Tax=Halomonas sp. hl-4 TaxID=1761789 RepID=UPI000BB80D6F|nr:formyltransferase family protein [Halomonas sp. hl-4]SNY98597.1 methionyl-tRNA formyltransferase [Halomonas sp. hl-4]